MGFSLKNLGQRLLDSTTLDEKASQFFRPKTGTLATVGRSWAQELAAKPVPEPIRQIPNAIRQTAPTVAQDFGNVFRNTFKNVPVLKTAGNIVGDFGQRLGSGVVDVAQGAYRTAQRPDILGKLQGATQTIRGVGKGLVAANPYTPFVDITANIGKEDSLSRRLATGYSRGISQIPELAPNTQAKNINIVGPKNKVIASFDPAMTAANMVGFVKNPINKKLFEATNKLIPSADKSLKLWLATTASRGGLENIILSLPDMPEKMTTAQKAQWMATNAGVGAVQEVVGQGIVKGVGKVFDSASSSRLGKMTTEAAAKQFDNLMEFKRKATIPVSKPGFGDKLGQTITEPMWKWEMGLVNDGSMKTYDSTIDTPKLAVEPISKSQTDLPQNIDTRTLPSPDQTINTKPIVKQVISNKSLQSSASEPIIPKSATPDEVGATLPSRLDNFVQKTLGYSTQTPVGGKREASMWTKGIRGVENKLTSGVEKAMSSENNLVRNAATNLQNFFRGAGMSPERAEASMNLRGGIATANERAYNVMDSLYKSLKNDKGSLERINAVLDPELAKTKIKLSDLTDTEKQVYGIIREGLDLVHDTSYANGHISQELYQANKGKYTPRLYDVMELPAEVNKFVTQGSKKINNDLYKQRTASNDWKVENSLNDPVYALGKRLTQVETNSAIKKYTDFLSSNPNLVSDVEKNGFTKLSDSPAYGALSGKYVLNSAAEDLKGFFFSNQAVQNLYDVFKAYDRMPIRQLQKKLLTVFNPTTNVGNIVSDQVFGFVTGVDPLTLNKNLIELKTKPGQFKQLSDYLMSKGIVGTDITRTDFVNKLSSIDELSQGKKPGMFQTVANKVQDFYGGTDDAYKVSAFKSLLDKGFTLEEATRKVADGFQNYANVGKFYDVWAKTPVVGSAFIKFQGDLMRIIKNGAVNNPLGLMAFLGTLAGVARLSSKASGETDSDREARENRFGAPMIPGLKIPLTWQTPYGEINAARYVSPFFANNEITDFSKMFPGGSLVSATGQMLNPKNQDKAKVLAQSVSDPLLSTPAQLLLNRDFRGKNISDPNETKYQPSTLTPGERLANQAKFTLRAYTPPPVNSLIDVKAAAEGKPNMYGAKQSVPQALARVAGIKVSQYGPEQVKEQKLKDAEFAGYANDAIDKQINSVYKQGLKGEITKAQETARIKALEDQKKVVLTVKDVTTKNTEIIGAYPEIKPYRYLDDNGDMQTIDITKPLESPKLTGQTEIDKKLNSSFKGKITSRINDIVKLVDAGQLDATKAEKMIKELQATSAKFNKGKKPKVINIKQTKSKKVSFKLGSSRPTLKLTAPKTKKSRLSLKNYKVGKIRV